MALSSIQQFHKLLASAEHVLILLPASDTPESHGDILAASYGFAHLAQAIGLTVTLAYDNTENIREMYAFLPEPVNIRHTLTHTRDFVLTFKTEHNNITNIRSEREDDMIEIRVTPEKGMIDSRDFSFGLAAFPYSALITLGAPDKESFGTLGEQMPDLFYDLPIINIDRGGANEHYGHINITTLTASSVSEVVTDLLLQTYPDAITSDVAQCLLTGLIVATDSFRSTHTSPNALTLASTLIARGANQQEIIDELFSKQPLAFLKLWGKALTNLHAYNDKKTLVTLITAEHFTQTQTQNSHIPQILSKIRNNHTNAQHIVALYHEKDSTDNNEQKYNGLIDVATNAELPENIFGKRNKNNFYEITFHAHTDEEAQQNITSLLEKNLQ